MQPVAPANAWIKTGGICGILGGCLYFLAAFVEMPPMLTYASAFAFAPLLGVGCTGLFYFLAQADGAPRSRIAWVSAIAGCLLLLAMLTVQQSMFSTLQQFPKKADGSLNTEFIAALNNIQWRLDVAGDIMISISLILFSYSMLLQTIFWKITGLIGLALALLLLFFNLYYFPQPRGEQESIDWGPLVGLWLLFVFTMLLTGKAKLTSPQQAQVYIPG